MSKISASKQRIGGQALHQSIAKSSAYVSGQQFHRSGIGHDEEYMLLDVLKELCVQLFAFLEQEAQLVVSTLPIPSCLLTILLLSACHCEALKDIQAGLLFWRRVNCKAQVLCA